ncbi:MAG TPA: hypothetical protein VGR35_00530 [Tepidisphaeraceae bacterium]|nr:hypothetical protein [Tepidisphaeraceae bacterium]
MAHPFRHRARRTRLSDPALSASSQARTFSEQALAHGLEPLEARRMLSVATDEQGWTVFGRSADTRIIYVSSSAGSDTNSGLAEGTPVKTIAKARTLLRNGAPDWMLLKRGDQWSENLTGWTRSGRSADEMMVIGAYGTGARPKLNTGTLGGFSNGVAPVAHVAIVSVHFHAHTRDTSSPDYAGVTAGSYGFHSSGSLSNVLVEDAVFDDYVYNLSVTGDAVDITDFTLRRSIITDAWSTTGKAQGMYANDVRGLVLEENFFDHNGWNEHVSGAEATIYSHSVYLSADNSGVVIRGNIIADSASHGVQARSGGIIENNVFLRNPINLLFGGGSPLVMPGGVEGRIVGNVFLDSRSISGSSRGTGLELANLKPGGNLVVTDNIFTADTHRKSAAITFGLTSDAQNISESMGINDLTMRKNIVYDWNSAWNMSESFRTGQSGYRGVNNVRMIENDFQKTAVSRIVRHGPAINTTHLYWQSNRYHNAFAPSGWFQVGTTLMSFDGWKSAAEPTAMNHSVDYADPARSLASYNASLGGSAAFDDFLTSAGSQDRLTLDERYTAAALINYIREGFAEAGIVPGGVATTYGPQAQDSTPADGPVTDPADLNGPGAILSAPPTDLNAPGSANHNFTVTYTDVSAIDLTTIGTGDVRVTGPNGYSQNATFVSRTTSNNGKTVVAVYGVRAPDGFWDITDSGTYNLALVSGAVRDTLGNNSAANSDFGSFMVDVPADTAPPAVSAAFAPSITSGGTAPQTFTITYTDETGIDLNTIGTGDVLVRFPDGLTQSAAYVSRTSSNSGKMIVATYTLAAPGGYWNVTHNGTYSVALADNAVRDLPGQGTPAAALGEFTVNIAQPDTAAPTATLTAPTHTTGGTPAYAFTVTFDDETAVDAATVGAGDITVTGPRGESHAVTFVSSQSSNSGKTIAAVYHIAAPGGFWDASDNGAYSVALTSGAVRDVVGNTTSAAAVGAFTVNIATDTAAPSPTLSAAQVTAPGGDVHTFTVVYNDATGVDAPSVGDGDLRVTGPGGFSQLANFVSRQSSTDGKTVTAVYTISAPGGEWDYFDNGTYQVALTAGAVRDVLGNATGAAGIGSFVVKILDTVAPVASLSVADVTAPGTDPHPFTITYTDNIGVDAGSVGAGDLVVIGPDGVERPATFVSRVSTDSGRIVTATYSIAAPGGSWDGTDHGTYRVSQESAQVTDLAGNAAAVGTLGTFDVTLTPPTPPPVVSDVFVSGSQWTASFRDFLQSSGQGDGTYGYRLTGAQHADELPWLNLNKISVRFSKDVTVSADALKVFGVRVAQYGGAVTYDPSTFTATWALASGAIANDKLRISLSAGGIIDSSGQLLDGEWTNPAETMPVTAGGADSYPSGNGSAGGDFNMRLNVLPGDVTRDGEVVGNDVTSVRLNQGYLPGQSGYTIFRDVTGDGEIIGNDVTGVRSRQGLVLPAGTP